MKKKKAIVYAPLTKLIAFDREKPRVVWVTSNKIFAEVAVLTDGKLKFRVTAKYEEALEGRCSLVDERHLRLYTEPLWQACETWLKRSLELDAWYHELSKGVVPPELHSYQQVALLETG